MFFFVFLTLSAHLLSPCLDFAEGRFSHQEFHPSLLRFSHAGISCQTNGHFRKERTQHSRDQGSARLERNRKGKTTWDKGVSANICGLLRNSAASCENLQLQKGVNSRRSKNQRKSAKKTVNWLRLSLLVRSLEIPLKDNPSPHSGLRLGDLEGSARYLRWTSQGSAREHDCNGAREEVRSPNSWRLERSSCWTSYRKGGFHNGGFGVCSLDPHANPERGQKRNDGAQKNRNEGTKNGTTVQKIGTGAHSPKPP